MRTVLIAAFAAFALAACDLLSPENECVLMVQYGIAVTVRDSATNERIDSGVVVIARSGEYADTARALNGDAFRLVLGRPGIYAVQVTRPGYRPWSRTSVIVGRDECGVVTTRLTARIAPEE